MLLKSIRKDEITKFPRINYVIELQRMLNLHKGKIRIE